jgi:Xaa-Pro aminopeptidase
MHADDIGVLVVASEANCLYLTGYETTFWGNKSKPFAVVFSPGRVTVVVCHAAEAPSVELDAVDVEVRAYGGPVDVGSAGVQLDYQRPASEAVAAAIKELEVGSVGLELTWHFMPGLTPSAFDRLRAEIDRTRIRDASGTIWSVRRRKSEWELAQMRLAAEACDHAHRSFAATARPGLTERELNRLLIGSAYEAGAEKIGYSGIVAGIDRAPLGGPTDRRWETGQLLMADICLQVNGYFADFNRVYANAPPTRAERRGYAAVVDGLERGREVARPGASVRAVAAAMIYDDPSPYARVGHGLGLEMPEPPSLSPDDGSSLREGEVLCLEPNRQVEGVGWLVSEEEVILGGDSCELLSPPFPSRIPEVG